MGGRDFRRLVGLLREPVAAAGLEAKDGPVYHLVVASGKADPARGVAADRALSDEAWAQISTDLMERTGLAKPGSPGGVRWIAVRHDVPGAEHVHILATLATEAGRRVTPRNDFYRIARSAPTTATGRRRRMRRGRRRTSSPRRRGLVGAAAAPHSAAEDYDRAARLAWGRLPEPSPAGSGVRAASGLLAAARLVRRPETAQMLALLAQLAVLGEAVGRMRTEQDRAVQAAAARRAAEQIRAEHTRRLAGVPSGPVQAARTAAVDAARHPGPRPPEQPRGRSR